MTDRGTGRTAKQMQDAPQGAFFVWPIASSRWYAERLAEYLCRKDLHVISVADLDTNELRGIEMSALILDHAAAEFMDGRHWAVYELLLSRVRIQT